MSDIRAAKYQRYLDLVKPVLAEMTSSRVISRKALDVSDILAETRKKMASDVLAKQLTYTQNQLKEMSPYTATVSAVASDHARSDLVDCTSLVQRWLAGYPNRRSRDSVPFSRRDVQTSDMCALGLFTEVCSQPAWSAVLTVNKHTYVMTEAALAKQEIMDRVRACRKRNFRVLTRLVMRLFKRGWLPLQLLAQCSHQRENTNRANSCFNVLTAKTGAYGARTRWTVSYNTELTFYKIARDPLPDDKGQHPRRLMTRTLSVADAQRSVQRYPHGRIRYTLSEPMVLFAFERISLELVQKPTWTLLEFMKVANVEHRRTLITRYGYDRLLASCESRVVEMDATPVHSAEPDGPSIVRALIELKEAQWTFRVVATTDGSSGRVYVLPASTPNRAGGFNSCASLAEWEEAIGQPAVIYAQA